MHIGYIVGTVVAASIIICGCIAAAYAKKIIKKVSGQYWEIIFGIAALISGVINFYLFNY